MRPKIATRYLVWEGTTIDFWVGGIAALLQVLDFIKTVGMGGERLRQIYLLLPRLSIFWASLWLCWVGHYITAASTLVCDDFAVVGVVRVAAGVVRTTVGVDRTFVS
jgi:hypothetical protein